MREAVVLKGSRNGLRLVLDETADFGLVVDQLRTKLDSATNFFTAGTAVQLPPVAMVPPEKREELIRLLSGYGLACQDAVDVPPKKPAGRRERKQMNEAAPIPNGEPLLVNRTLRGGQKIVHSGSVVVNGDLNPGAAVIASGNITIRGACRGMAHAGAQGDANATVTVGRLLAGQLRIADLIVRAPDEMEAPDYPEVARIVDGAVVIEPADVKEGDVWAK
ncbi:MAG TPA: septum site-determining protein MinC [Patescibacteria group bacterium]|nr:septum site-determining protein MinC [Patescibacteria group bacterium]